MKILFWIMYGILLLGGAIGLGFIKNIYILGILATFFYGGWLTQIFFQFEDVMFNERF